MAKKTRRKSKKNSLESVPLPRPSRGRRRKGLNMKIAADGSMHIRHMSEITGVAFMPPVEVALVD